MRERIKMLHSLVASPSSVRILIESFHISSLLSLLLLLALTSRHQNNQVCSTFYRREKKRKDVLGERGTRRRERGSHYGISPDWMDGGLCLEMERPSRMETEGNVCLMDKREVM